MKTSKVKQKKGEMRFWDFYSVVYDLLRDFAPYVRMQYKVVNHLKLIPNLTILDAGCGSGNTIEKIEESRKEYSGLRIVGLDASLSMLNRARRKLANVSDLRLLLGDFNEVPPPNIALTPGESLTSQAIKKFGKRYDRIISVNGLYTSLNPLDTLKGWHESLEDGGILVVVNPFIPKQWLVYGEYFRDFFKNKSFRESRREIGKLIFRLPTWLLFVTINQYLAYKAKGKKLHFLRPAALQELAAKAGFKIIDKELVYGGGFVLASFQKDSRASVRRAQTPEEIETIFSLRYNIYCKEISSIDPRNCSGDRELDKFDLFATHFIARKDGRIVGCARVIPDSKNGFLLEEYFKPLFTNKKEREVTLEISRATLLPEIRGGSLFIDLMSAAVQHGLGHDYSNFIGASTKEIWGNFIKNGWDIEIWSNYAKYHNTISAPALIKPPLFHEEFMLFSICKTKNDE